MSPKFVGTGIVLFVILVILILINPFRQVAEGERGIVLRMGEAQDKILEPGLHVVTPFIDKVETMDVTVQKEEVQAGAASKDLQSVSANIALNYHLDSMKLVEVWKETKRDYNSRLIQPAIQEAIKGATAKYTAEELITKRSEVKDVMQVALSERLSTRHIIIDEISITNFSFSSAFDASIEAKQVAEQDALRASRELEKIKIEAEQKIATARAEAESIRIQAQAVTQQGGKDYVSLQWIEAWKSGGAKVPQFITSDNGGGFIFNMSPTQ